MNPILNCKKKGTPFVLIRIYNPVVSGLNKINEVINTNWSNEPNNKGFIEDLFFKRLETALYSVQKNNANLILCDDTNRTNISKYDEHNKYLLALLKKHEFNKDNNLFIVESTGGEGSAMAMWRLRKHFLYITSKMTDEMPFAVLLDQDDELCEDAIKNIKSKMGKNTIVISDFETRDPNNLNIVLDNGEKHKNSLKLLHSHKIAQMSSIGWTKAYSREAIYIMVSDFEEYFNKYDKTYKSCEDFFKKNKSYEDFLDFYMLLRKGIKIKINQTISHLYYKHIGSITATPNIKDFTEVRTTMLHTLSMLCIEHSSKLKINWKKQLISFLTEKITAIEGILEKYRNEEKQEIISGTVFKDTTQKGSFADLLNKTYPNTYIKAAVNKYKKIDKKTSSKKKETEESYLSSGNRQLKAYKKFAKRCNKLVFYLVVLILSITFKISIEDKKIQSFFYNHRIDIPFIDISLNENIEHIIEILSIFATIFTVVYSVIQSKEINAENKIEEEKSIKKIFISDFKDMIRHLGANLMVLIQIRTDIEIHKDKETRPALIHFENLKLQNDSKIFADNILPIIGRNKADDIIRLQINLRNMNNSAEWLKSIVEKEDYSNEKMIKALDWEIYRIMAYFVNAIYMDSHDLRFAQEKELDEFMTSSDIQNRLKSLFINKPPQDREEAVAKYIKIYYEDRRKMRKINFM